MAEKKRNAVLEWPSQSSDWNEGPFGLKNLNELKKCSSITWLIKSYRKWLRPVIAATGGSKSPVSVVLGSFMTSFEGKCCCCSMFTPYMANGPHCGMLQYLKNDFVHTDTWTMDQLACISVTWWRRIGVTWLATFYYLFFNLVLDWFYGILVHLMII